MDMKMSGRNALVTGASKGIGFAISRSFALAGANVAMVARRADVLEEAKAEIAKVVPKAKLVAIAGDVSKAEDCARIFAAAEKGLGQVDVLVNNAGKSATGVFETITDEAWQEDIDLKLLAAIRLARLAFPGMKARKWGRIVNVLNSGAKAPRAESAPTSVSRAAGMALTKVLAGEGAPHNVLVNGVLVGLIESDQWVRRHAAEKKNRPIEHLYAEMGARVPMGRVGRAQEFANMVLFLASDAGSYITGTAINIDGGMTPVV
jgi:NAD(P)-dependent dehydrogenase (short-subunit alcohol dehydrogenase family)